jgi:hypothetical protein
MQRQASKLMLDATSSVLEYNCVNSWQHTIDHFDYLSTTTSARLLLHRLYINYVVRRNYSAGSALLQLRHASGCLGSSHGLSSTTSRTPCAMTTCLQPQRLYCAYAMHPDAPSRRSTSRWSVVLALAVCPVTPPRISTTRCPAVPTLLRLRCAPGRVVSPLDFSSAGCTGSRRVPGHSASRLDYSSPDRTGSTASTSCIQTCRLAARLLVGRSH